MNRSTFMATSMVQSIICMLCTFFVVVMCGLLPMRAEAASEASPSDHDKLLTVYNLIASSPFHYNANEIDLYGETALRLKGDQRLYALWRVLYAYMDDQNAAKFNAWHDRIVAQAQTDDDTRLDVLARFMYQSYQNENNGFTALSEREWAAYLAMTDPAIRNIVDLERIRQMQHFSQWADDIDMGDKLIVRLNAEGNNGAALLAVAHQTSIYALFAVGDNTAYTDHMMALARLMKDNAFFSQKMDTLYNMSLWASKQNDLDVAVMFQRLYGAYVETYHVADLVTWNEFLCATLSDKRQDYRGVVTCLRSSTVRTGAVTSFLDYTKLLYLTKAYAQLGDVVTAKAYLKKLQAVPDEFNPHDTLFEKGIDIYLLKAEGRDKEAFDALEAWSRDRMQHDEDVRIQSVRSMYKALRQELDSKTAESRLLVKQVQMGRLLLATSVAVAVLFGVIMLGAVLWVVRMRRMQARLSEARAHAEAANAAKSRFLAVMSHELRTPLNGVLGMAQALKKQDLPPVQHEQVNILVESGQTLMVLLNDVLDMSRIEAGRIELAPTVSNMKDMVERVLQTYRPLLADKPIELVSHIRSSAIMPMRFDILRVYQCLSNLISNALKFTEQGQVRVEVSAERRDGRYMVRVEVQDTGIGMDEATLARLFDAYAQGSAMTAQTYGGSGLGLNISRQLAEVMGGGLSVSSEVGKGTVFVMTFSADEVEVEATVAAEQESHEETADRGSPDAGENVEHSVVNILLVDDHPVNRKVARLFLEPFGYTVTEAVDGREALDMDMSRFDLVLMDINMPRLNGLEATRLYRAQEAPGHHLPIVALTADAMQEQIEACYAAGLDAHIAKPILMDTLIETVNRLLEQTGKLTSPAPAVQAG